MSKPRIAFSDDATRTFLRSSSAFGSYLVVRRDVLFHTIFNVPLEVAPGSSMTVAMLRIADCRKDTGRSWATSMYRSSFPGGGEKD